jgi:hypothetical protein
VQGYGAFHVTAPAQDLGQPVQGWRFETALSAQAKSFYGALGKNLSGFEVAKFQ